MQKKLTIQLYKKYPELFGQVFYTIERSGMGFGFQCGDGWYGILTIVCNLLSNHSLQSGLDIKFVQVKEKYGGLRIYIQNSDKYTDGVCEFAEEMSYHICELCGNKGKVFGERWIMTRCENCKTE